MTERFLRLTDIIGRKPSTKHAGIPALIPICASSLWLYVRTGKFPKPIKLGARTTVWTASSVNAWIAGHAANAA